MTAGYSKRTLIDKLGIKPGARVAFVHAPDGYADLLGTLPDGVTAAGLDAPRDFIHAFYVETGALAAEFPRLKAALAQTGMLWISWPKGSSGVTTDLNENVVREIGLENGLVDVKVAAIDAIWSGLKFVYRLKDRS